MPVMRALFVLTNEKRDVSGKARTSKVIITKTLYDMFDYRYLFGELHRKLQNLTFLRLTCKPLLPKTSGPKYLFS